MDQPLNRYIDQTLLRPDATAEEIHKLCSDSIAYHFAAVCLSPTWVPLAKELLKGSGVKLCSVVGFPLGANTSETKAFEAKTLAALGAEELDMVINIGALKSKEYQTVRADIQAVVQAAPTALIKVILETCLLSDEEKRIGAELCLEAKAAFVKTSTGFSKAGATLHDVALLRAVVGPTFGVKASGGIKDRSTALAMIQAGASRLGTSSGAALILVSS